MAVSRVIPFDDLRTFAAHELAKRIRDTYGGPREVSVGTEWFALDLSAARCSLCGGAFAPIGRATFVLDHHGDVRYGHRGCFGQDLDAWRHGPECENGCEVCDPTEEGA